MSTYAPGAIIQADKVYFDSKSGNTSEALTFPILDLPSSSISTDKKNELIERLRGKYKNILYQRVCSSSRQQSKLLQDHYVPVSLSHHQRELDIDKLFSEEVNHIIVEGESGIGKTTWCQHLVNAWAYKKILQQFDLIIHIPLGALYNQVNKLSSINVTITELDVLATVWGVNRTDVQYTGLLIQLSTLLKDYSDKPVLYILEGWDEVPQFTQSDIYTDLINNLLNKKFVLLSMRPMSPPENFRCDMLANITGLNESAQKIFIHKYFEDSMTYSVDEINKMINGLMLLSNKFRQDSQPTIFANPFLLEIVCWLFSRNELNIINNNHIPLTFLYNRIIIQLQRSWEERYRKRTIAQSENDLDGQTDLLAIFYETLAYQAWKSTGSYLPSTLIKYIYSKYKKNFKCQNICTEDIFISYGLLDLQQSNIDKDLINNDYSFRHYSLQEFYTAKYLYRQIIADKNSNPIDILCRLLNPDHIANLMNLKSRVLPFLYGLLNSSLDDEWPYRDFIKNIYEKFDALSSIDQDKITVFVNCLKELNFSESVLYKDQEIIPEILSKHIWITICSSGLSNIAKWWVSRNQEIIYTQSQLNRSTLHFVCASGDVDFINYIISNIPENKKYNEINHISNEGRIPLHVASYSSNPKITQTLINHGANVNTIDRHGESPLLLALRAGNIEVGQILWKNGASLDIINKIGESVYYFIKIQRCFKEFGFTEVTIHKELINQENNLSDKQKLIRSICVYGEIKMLQKTIYSDPGYKVDSLIIDETGENLLTASVYRGHKLVVKLLASIGCNLKYSNVYGRTALHIAAMRGHTEIAEILINHCPDLLFMKDAIGATPAWIARAYSQYGVLKLLDKVMDQHTRTKPSDSFSLLRKL